MAAPVVVTRLNGVDSSGATGQVVLAFTSNTIHNAIVVMVTILASSSTGITVSDTAGNTYRQAADIPGTPLGVSMSQRIFIAEDIFASAGANTVTVVVPGSNPAAAFVYEVSGLSNLRPTDKVASAKNTSSLTPSSGATAATTYANELVLAIMHDNGSTTGTVTAGTGYTNAQVPTPTNGLTTAAEEKIVSATGAQTGTFNNTGSNGLELTTVITFADTTVAIPPIVTTQAESSIGKTTATGNGNITDTGAATPDERGFVYDTVSRALPGNVAPASSGYASAATDTGSFTTGAFTKAMTGLAKNTTFFVRAYAHNSAGYGYGSEVSFAVLTSVPLVDALSDTDNGFVDDVTGLADDKLLMEDGFKLLLEDNTSKLVLNYSYPSADYMTYNRPTALTPSTLYYWRARQYAWVPTSVVTQTMTFPNSVLWTAPPGVTSVTIQAWGAGGGGGGSLNGSIAGANGGGGGGGAYASSTLPVTPGKTYLLSVGLGGLGGTGSATPTAGANGGDTTFSGDGATVIANGGGGGGVGSPGAGGAAGATGSSTGAVKVAGGIGGAGAAAAVQGGGGGGSAGSSTAGGAGVNTGVAGAAGTPNGAIGGTGSNGGIGGNGVEPGSGAGGAGSSAGGSAGGIGAPGRIVLVYQTPIFTKVTSPWSEVRSFTTNSGSGPATITPAGVASGEAFGSPTVTPGQVTGAPVGIPSSEIFGAIALAQFIAPNGVPSSEAVGVAAVAPGQATISPIGIPTAERIGSPAITAVATITLVGIPSGEGLGAPAVVPGQVTIIPVGISSAEQLGTSALSASATISPASIGSAETFGGASLTQALVLAAIQSAEAMGATIITPGQVTIAPAAIPSAERSGNPAITATANIAPVGIASAEAPGNVIMAPIVILMPAGIASAEAFGPAVITPGTATILPVGIGTAEKFGTPIIIPSATISPAGIPSGEAVGNVALTTLATISPTGIGSGERFGSVVVTPGQVTILPASISSAERVGYIALNTTVTIAPIGIAGAEQLGYAAIVTSNIITAAGIPSAEQVGAAVTTPGQVTIAPASIRSAEIVNSMVVQPGQASILLVGIASGEAVGTIAIRLARGVLISTIPTILAELDEADNLTAGAMIDILSQIPGEISIIGGDIIDSLSSQSTTDIL